MSERKVLNKYYPPDFDPSKIPRLHLPKERQYTVRLMAPCNMKCKTCGEYIYKGKKFNARKETVQGEDYLGLKIFRFYIKCTRCLAEITFKTDPQNADYIVEHGATRNFQALKLAEEQAEREQRDKDEEEASNPMKLLENRTKASKQEMDVMESLEELRELQERHANIDYEKILNQHADQAAIIRRQQEDEDEAFVQSIFGNNGQEPITKRILDDDDDSDEDPTRIRLKNEVIAIVEKSTDLLSTVEISQPPNKKVKQWEKSVGALPVKSLRHGIVKRRNNNCGTANLLPKAAVPSFEKTDIIKPPAPTGLGLIGGYSDSSDDNTDSN